MSVILLKDKFNSSKEVNSAKSSPAKWLIGLELKEMSWNQDRVIKVQRK